VQYTYDNLQRLRQVRYADGSLIDYVYDSLGNRLMKTTTLASAPANTPPNAVAQPGIANGAVNVPTLAVLNWTATTDPNGGDSVVYCLYLGTTPNPPLVYIGWQPNWAPGLLDCFTKYYWYVTTRDSHNAQTKSPVWSFTTGDTPPAPEFSSLPASGQAPLTVQFRDESLYRCGVGALWQWDFNHDGVTDAVGQNPSFKYSAAGDYTVKLTVGNEHGSTASLVKTNLISVLGANIVDLSPLEAKVLSAGPYRNLVVSYAVTNTGTISLSGKWQWTDCFYLTTNSILDAKAMLANLYEESAALPVGAVYRRTNLLTVLTENLAGYRLFLRSDGLSGIVELNEGNNVRELVLDQGLPDLVAGDFSWSGPAVAGQTIEVAYSVTNRGPLAIRGLADSEVEFFDMVYLSTNAAWNPGAAMVGSGNFSGTLASGESYRATNAVYLPSWPPGNYHLLLRADAGNLVVESNSSNNFVSVPISIAAPDLAPLRVIAPLAAAADARIEIVYTATNRGSAPALGFWADSLYLSADAVWDAQDYSLGDIFQEGPIATQAAYHGTNSVRLPGWPPGAYYIISRVDSWKILAEASESNNELAFPITLTAPLGLPDLTPFSLETPGSALPGASVEVVYGVTNIGPTAATGEWFDMVWFSTNTFKDDAATTVGFVATTGPVAKGGSYFQTSQITIPKVEPGLYYLIVEANAMGMAEEATGTNNFLAQPIVVEPADILPDLAVSQFDAPSVALPRQTIPISFVVANQGGSAATGMWMDYLLLSDTPDLSGNEPSFLGFWMNTQGLASGDTYTISQTVALPNIPLGDYYLVLSVNMSQSVNESVTDNNMLAVPITLQSTTTVADLAAASLIATATAAPGQTIQITYAITNLGTATATGSWLDSLVLSTNQIYDNKDYPLSLQVHVTPVAAAAGYAYTTSAALPAWPPGDYYLILKVDTDAVVTESPRSNNTLVVPIALQTTPVRFRDIQLLADGRCRLGIDAAVGATYKLKVSTNLVAWSDLLDWTCTNSTATLVLPATPGTPRSFYRLAAP
jgi:PKD repeat protein